MIKINFDKEAHENCFSFEKCSTNRCPLHKQYNKLEDKPEDKVLLGWKKCRSNKLSRMKVAKAFRLKSLGLSDRERANLKRSIEMKKQILLTRDKQTKLPLNDTLGVKNEV